MSRNSASPAVICVANGGNEASLQLWKIYQSIRDNDARSEGFLRVIDESGEDYLFPEENFASIDLPTDVQRTFERAVRAQRKPATAPRVASARRRAGAGRKLG